MSFDLPFGAGAFGAADPAESFGPAPEWTTVVMLAAVDVSAQLTGRVVVSGEESTARLANFTLRPTGGVVDVRDWINAAVTIDYVERGGATERLFTGKVLEPIYDPRTRLTRFRCSDDLQGFFESKTETEILTLLQNGGSITGRYSKQVFGVREDGWRQAEDVLETIPAGFDLLRDGVTTALTEWAAAPPTAEFNESMVRDLDIKIIKSRDLVNTVKIEADYEFAREHHREHEFYWNWPGLCDFIGNPYELPTRDMWAEAASSLKWLNKLGGICHRTLPPSGEYCNGQGLAVSDEARDTRVTSALWRAVRRWVQTVSEHYDITVQEAGSVAQYGVKLAEDGAGYRVKNDDAAWNASLETADPDSPTGGALAGYSYHECGATMLSPGESWVWTDKVDEPERLNFLRALVQIADRKIRQSHRSNYVSWTTWIQPTLERTQSMRINAGGINATGKVLEFRHELNITGSEGGRASTFIKIAVSKCPSGGSQDAIDAPAQPDTESGYSDPDEQTLLSTYIGFADGVPAYDENWAGFTSNRSSYVGVGVNDNQIYPIRIRVDGPDIEVEAVDEIEADQIVTINTLVPDETLEVSV